MLVVLNLPLIGIWVKLLKVPYRLLFPCIMTMMGIGIYSLNNSSSDVYLMAFFGFVGYIFVKCRCNFPPLILAMVLGPLMEESLRRALLISRGDPTVFFTRPISLGFMCATGVLLVIFLFPVFRRKKREILVEED
jgi:TctA family transporter